MGGPSMTIIKHESALLGLALTALLVLSPTVTGPPATAYVPCLLYG